MKFTKSELTKASKDIAYVNKKVIDAICACEDLFTNEVFLYILKEECASENKEEYDKILKEVAIRLKKYSNDLFAGDTELNASTLSEASSVFNSVYNLIDDLDN